MCWRITSKNRNRLQPYQVGLVWNKLGKAVLQQKSSRNNNNNNKLEQRQGNFWFDHETNLRTLVAHTMESVNDFNGISTATVTHSLAKLISLTDSPKNLASVQSLWNALLVRTAIHLKSDSLNAHDISNLLWAYAKTHHIGSSKTHEKLLDALANTTMRRVNDFSPQGLANVAWAYATMNHTVPSLLGVIARTAQMRVDDFNPQALANIAWGHTQL
jgi:hypothetical protein